MCGKVTDENQVVELFSAVENLLVKNELLNTKILGLVNQRNTQDEEMAKMIRKLKCIWLNTTNVNAKSMYKLDENANDVHTEDVQVPSLGLTGCVASIGRHVLLGILSLVVEKTGFSKVLEYFGTEPRNVEIDSDKSDISEHVDEELELEHVEGNRLKRRRPDTDQVCPQENQIRLKNIVTEQNVKALNDSYWRKKPIINFVNDKVAGIKTISDSEDLMRNLSPKSNPKTKIFIRDTEKLQITLSESFEEVLMDNKLMIQPSDSFGDNINKDLTGCNITGIETSTPLILDEVGKPFVFSASKMAGDAKDELAEQSMISLMTFEEKKIYFAQKIQEEEEAAMRGSMTPLRIHDSQSPLPPPSLVNFKSPFPSQDERKLKIPQISRRHLSPIAPSAEFLTQLNPVRNPSILDLKIKKAQIPSIVADDELPVDDAGDHEVLQLEEEHEHDQSQVH